MLTVGAVVVVLAACSAAAKPSAPGKQTTRLAAGLLQAPVGVPGAGFQALHVAQQAGGAAYIANAAGQRVFLRGVAAVGMEDIAYTNSGTGPPLYPINPSDYDGKCPQVSALGSQGPLCEVEADKPALAQSSAPDSHDDFAEMRSLGIDTVRLVLDWSELEPLPGQYSQTYIDRIAQVVGWAQAQGIAVILDMHEDEYSRFILPSPKSSSCTPSGGYDGAPLWAVFTDGEPACAVAGQADLNPAVAAAFDNFWHNRRVPGPQGAAPGPGLQDHYIGALAALARRFDSDPAVIGYELMNEPLPGAHSSLPLVSIPEFSATELYPFYERAIEAITGVDDGLSPCPKEDPTGFMANGPPPYAAMPAPCSYPDLGVHTNKLIFFEPSSYRNLLDFSPQVSKPFTTYPNIVYAPHIYTHAFTLDSFVGETPATSTYPPSYSFGYQTAASEAEAMHAAVYVTEFGDNSGSDSEVLSNELAAQDRTLTGGTLWAWDGLSQNQADCWCVHFEQSNYSTSQNGLPGSGNPKAPIGQGQFITSRVNLLEQPFPEETTGDLEGFTSVPGGAFVMAANQVGAPSALARYTVVYEPADWRGDSVRVSGAASLADVIPDGKAALLLIRPGVHGGAYGVVIAAPGSTPASVKAAEASLQTQPLPAISLRVALATVTRFIDKAEKSSNPTIAANAKLVAGLSKVVLAGT